MDTSDELLEIGERRETYHDKRSNDPIDNSTEQNLYPDVPIPEYAMQCLELDFAEDRVHHDEQPNSYRDRHTDELPLLQSNASIRYKVTQDDPNNHSEEDP